MPYCIKCGKKLPKNASYCPNCGHSTEIHYVSKPPIYRLTPYKSLIFIIPAIMIILVSSYFWLVSPDILFLIFYTLSSIPLFIFGLLVIIGYYSKMRPYIIELIFIAGWIIGIVSGFMEGLIPDNIQYTLFFLSLGMFLGGLTVRFIIEEERKRINYVKPFSRWKLLTIILAASLIASYIFVNFLVSDLLRLLIITILSIPFTLAIWYIFTPIIFKIFIMPPLGKPSPWQKYAILVTEKDSKIDSFWEIFLKSLKPAIFTFFVLTLYISYLNSLNIGLGYMEILLMYVALSPLFYVVLSTLAGPIFWLYDSLDIIILDYIENTIQFPRSFKFIEDSTDVLAFISLLITLKDVISSIGGELPMIVLIPLSFPIILFIIGIVMPIALLTTLIYTEYIEEKHINKILKDLRLEPLTLAP